MVHKEGQAYDENIGAEIRLADSADPRYYVLTYVDVALKVKKNIPTKHQPCDNSNYDKKLLAKATERMMLVAGFSSMAIYLTLPFLLFLVVIRLCGSLCRQNGRLSYL